MIEIVSNLLETSMPSLCENDAMILVSVVLHDVTFTARTS